MASWVALCLIWTSVAAAMEIPMQCQRDSDCGAENGDYYCLDSMCERCIPCEQLLNRRFPLYASGRVGCARTEEDCGVCLPGYQSEDLTGQRHSIKCFPTSFNELPSHPATIQLSMAALSSIAVSTVLVIVAVAGCFLLISRISRKSSTVEQSGASSNEESRKLVDRLPPPYELPDEPVGLVRASEQTYTLGYAQQEHLNEATPFSYRHSSVANMDSEEDDGLLNLPVGAQLEDGNGSTETIPSTWEPISEMDLNQESQPEDVATCRALLPRRLFRSQSLEMPSVNAVSSGLRIPSHSDPSLASQPRQRLPSGGETYAHRHIRLSTYRLPTLPVNPPANESRCTDPEPRDTEAFREQTDEFEDCEPGVPQSFVFDESRLLSSDVSYTTDFLASSLFSFTGSLYGRPISSSSPNSNEASRGSQDSGFFDQSRRRPATDEMSFEFNISFKRPREFE